MSVLFVLSCLVLSGLVLRPVCYAVPQRALLQGCRRIGGKHLRFQRPDLHDAQPGAAAGQRLRGDAERPAAQPRRRSVYTLHFAFGFCVLHFAFCILRFVFCVLRFALGTFHFTICTLHFFRCTLLVVLCSFCVLFCVLRLVVLHLAF